MYMPSRSSSQFVPKSSIWQQRRPGLTLNGPQPSPGSYTAAQDDPYPSPPMSDSPASPRRQSQLLEERTSGSFTVSGAGAPASSSGPAARTTMTSQVLMSTAQSPQQTYPVAHGAILHPGYDFGPRPPPLGSNAPIGTPYATGFSVGPVGVPPPLLQAQPLQPHMSPAAYSGPTPVSSTTTKIQRPSRRTKAHVAKACQNCKKAHLSCDEARPCARCVASGKQPTCVDVQHKKRGRPRLRDDRERPEHGNTTTSFAPAPPPAIARGGGHSRSESFEYQRQARPSASTQQNVAREPPQPVRALPQPDLRAGTVTDIFYPARHELTQGPAPLVAFLNLDLRILKCNELFSNVFAPGGDPKGRLLSEFVDPRHSSAVIQLQNGLREERTQREPTYLPGIFPDQQEQEAVDALDEGDVERITQGSNDRPEQWTYILADGQPELMHSRVRLAKTSIYFAVITIRRIAQPATRRSATLSRPEGIELGGPVVGHSSHAYPQLYQPVARSPLQSSFSSSPFAGVIGIGNTAPPLLGYSAPGHVSPWPDQGYLPRSNSQQASPLTHMQPPPQPVRPPSATSEPRPNSARERRRPEPLGSLHLPPIVSSAPTTPLSSDFFQQSGPVQTGSIGLQTPEQGEGRDSQDEGARKRRRMDITDMVEK